MNPLATLEGKIVIGTLLGAMIGAWIALSNPQTLQPPTAQTFPTCPVGGRCGGLTSFCAGCGDNADCNWQEYGFREPLGCDANGVCQYGPIDYEELAKNQDACLFGGDCICVPCLEGEQKIGFRCVPYLWCGDNRVMTVQEKRNAVDEGKAYDHDGINEECEGGGDYCTIDCKACLPPAVMTEAGICCRPPFIIGHTPDEPAGGNDPGICCCPRGASCDVPGNVVVCWEPPSFSSSSNQNDGGGGGDDGSRPPPRSSAASNNASIAIPSSQSSASSTDSSACSASESVSVSSSVVSSLSSVLSESSLSSGLSSSQSSSGQSAESFSSTPCSSTSTQILFSSSSTSTSHTSRSCVCSATSVSKVSSSSSFSSSGAVLNPCDEEGMDEGDDSADKGIGDDECECEEFDDGGDGGSNSSEPSDGGDVGFSSPESSDSSSSSDATDGTDDATDISDDGSDVTDESSSFMIISSSSSSYAQCDFCPACVACRRCGLGLFNVCDAQECGGLGLCVFEPGIVGGSCLPDPDICSVCE